MQVDTVNTYLCSARGIVGQYVWVLHSLSLFYNVPLILGPAGGLGVFRQQLARFTCLPPQKIGNKQTDVTAFYNRLLEADKKMNK